MCTFAEEYGFADYRMCYDLQIDNLKASPFAVPATVFSVSMIWKAEKMLTEDLSDLLASFVMQFHSYNWVMAHCKSVHLLVTMQNNPKMKKIFIWEGEKSVGLYDIHYNVFILKYSWEFLRDRLR